MIAPRWTVAAACAAAFCACSSSSSTSGAGASDPGLSGEPGEPGEPGAHPGGHADPAAPTPDPGTPHAGAPDPAASPADPDVSGNRTAGEPRGFVALTDGEVAAVVAPHLAAGEELAHRAFRGPFGPGEDTVLAVVERDGRFAAFAVVPGGGAGKPGRRIDFPDMNRWLAERVPAVLFFDVDPGGAGDARDEVIVMTTQMTGAGPQGAIPRPFNFAFAWTGEAFAHVTAAEDAIDGLETAAEIRAALRAR